MSLISDQDLKEFQRLYKARFGKDIPAQEAYEKGMQIIRFAELAIEDMIQSEERHQIADDDTREDKAV